jgi:hypothetical protein
MRIFIGMWERGLTVMPRPEDETTFRRMGRLDATVSGRSFLFCFGETGTVGEFSEVMRPNNGGRAMRYELPVPLEEFPCRFCLHETEVEIGDEGYSMTWTPPPDHLLPWPDHRAMARYHPEELPRVARRELEGRLRSALPHGRETARTTLQRSPEWVRRELGSAGWAEVVSSVIRGGSHPQKETEECT